jgi:hypothetical protein
VETGTGQVGRQVQLPPVRGPLSAELVSALGTDPTALRRPEVAVEDALRDDDLQLALWIAYELHYRGFDGVADGLEWCLPVIEYRSALEDTFVAALRERVPVAPVPDDVPAAVASLAAADVSSPLSRYLDRQATRQQRAEVAMHRAVYEQRRADAHSWAIPRLHGEAKAVLIQVQDEEYGGGAVERMPGPKDSQGSQVDDVPGITLAASNLVALFGLHRARRGALVGHLAVSERRPEVCGHLAAEEPDLSGDILFGAAACSSVDGLFAEHVLRRWGRGLSSLRRSPVIPEGAEPAGA